MGKASKWFRSLLNPKQKRPRTDKEKPNRRWSFIKSYREKDHTPKHNTFYGRDTTSSKRRRATTNKNEVVFVAENVDQNKRAIAVAAAAADAVAAAAQVVAAVVRLTSGRRDTIDCGWTRDDQPPQGSAAAVKIQSAFRGYLARKALWALRGLVRLQALVRGHNERKRTTDWLKQMNAMMRAQARATAIRAKFSHSITMPSHSQSHQPGPPTPEKVEHSIISKSPKNEQSSMLKRNGSRVAVDQEMPPTGCNHQLDNSRNIQPHYVRFCLPSDEKTDKILEIDPGKPHKHRNIFHSTPLSHVPYSCDFVKPLKFSGAIDESQFYIVDNSPRFYSASSKDGTSRKSSFAPDGSRSLLNGYSDYPNYMACTESSRAKMRSISVPKQRAQYERSFSTNGNSIHRFGESTLNTQRISDLHANFTSKAYPGSCRLERIGMPVGYRY